MKTIAKITWSKKVGIAGDSLSKENLFSFLKGNDVAEKYISIDNIEILHTGITREQLESELAKIGWRIEKSGNGLNDWIINHFGEQTSFVVHG